MLHGFSGEGENEIEIPFVTRLPGTYQLEKELRQKAASNQTGWIDIGKFSEKETAARYKVQTFKATLYERQYDFVVCSSDHLDARRQKKLKKLIDEEKRHISSMSKNLRSRHSIAKKMLTKAFIN